ncbi:aminopeptidase N [Phycicoccus endophyticus]|uniref:Aminopeptidase N n=1 Tax=Phycicoccus endophyticus TaxID=1690220 RepID=A0A7G9R3E6_9MICO|nr:aminopeptidase N [Phycicoccus endophyticus]NHI19877.1 aminopeptidase N [Phycicoccus endophyticus]QNN50121.1 aminopeptidase N [Phycicoccus endophyticus]GGL27821.1 aminopeptidase N [Phycicoccus endophyticus]
MPGTNLTREEAAARAALVTVDTHDVVVDVTTSEETFSTTSTIRFACSSPGAETFLDFVGASVEQITLNGTDLDPREHFADSRVRLTGLAEDNEVVVAATGRFTNTGEGLHRFVDPVDGEVYLYTQFEVPDSRRMYPVFEQPDLKAAFGVTVTAPAHWQVVSNSPTPEPRHAGDGVSTWAFERTPRISSYITALVAGPYDVVRDSVSTRGGEVPLGIFCRRSLTPYLDADNLFALTKAGFAFFEEEFDCAYPFAKYDQLFSPEYNMGAMENAGCVTIAEVYVFRSKVPEALVERRALTVLHELAHMWFGDLVTMRWWNDLWLNESFAEWASTTCQAEATEWTDAWTTFGTYEKDWAYAQDQLSTTHPIVAQIRDLQDVEVNFDGITYAKGASVLKQLVAYVGRDAFREGLRTYFRKHAWGNTTLADLLVELEATSGRDLRSWSRAWLETAGVNTLRPLVEVDEYGRVTSAVVEQTFAEGYPTLRPHRLGIGLYEVRDGALHRTDLLEVDVEGARTQVPALVGRQQPDLLLVNDDDLAYAKIRLDERSLATALAHPRGFTSSLPRALVLASAWDMTRDAEMGARSFVELVLASLPGESDSTLLRTLLLQLRTAVFSYTAPAHREQTRERTRDTLWEVARGAAPGSDAQLQLVTAAAGFTAAGDDTGTLRGLYEGTEVLDGLEVDFEMRWTLLTALAAAGGASAQEVAAEQAREDTATARERAARTRAAVPTPEAKEQAWREAVEGGDLPPAVVSATGLGFARAGTPAELLRPYVQRYHAMLDTVQGKGSHALVEAVVLGFYPRALADADLLAATQRWLEEHPTAPAALRRLVTENRDPVVRALAAQERDARD